MGNLVSAVDELLSTDVADLPDALLGEEIVELRRQANRIEAAYLTRLEAFDRRGAASADRGSTQAWLREACRLAPNRAHRDVHLARDLADVLPATRAALGDGELSVEHAQLIASLRPAIKPEALASAEPHLVEFAQRAPPKELRGVVTHVKHSYAPEKVRDDEADDYDRRELHAGTILDGVGVGNWTLHPMEGVAVAATSRRGWGRASRPTPSPTTSSRPLERDRRSSGHPARETHRPVPVWWQTPTGQPGSAGHEHGLPPPQCRRKRARTACSSKALRPARPAQPRRGCCPHRDRLTAAMRRAIMARDRHCIWPGCDTPAGWCDCHHAIHWAHGGPTSIDNGVLLCGRHHDRVHQHRHAIITEPSGRKHVDPRPDSDPRTHDPP